MLCQVDRLCISRHRLDGDCNLLVDYYPHFVNVICFIKTQQAFPTAYFVLNIVVVVGAEISFTRYWR